MTRRAAQAAYTAKAEEFGLDPDDPDCEGCGNAGDLEQVDSVEVELTPEGLLEFANRFAGNG